MELTEKEKKVVETINIITTISDKESSKSKISQKFFIIALITIFCAITFCFFHYVNSLNSCNNSLSDSYGQMFWQLIICFILFIGAKTHKEQKGKNVIIKKLSLRIQELEGKK